MPGFSIFRGTRTQRYWGLSLQSQTPKTPSFCFTQQPCLLQQSVIPSYCHSCGLWWPLTRIKRFFWGIKTLIRLFAFENNIWIDILFVKLYNFPIRMYYIIDIISKHIGYDRKQKLRVNEKISFDFWASFSKLTFQHGEKCNLNAEAFYYSFHYVRK